MKTKRALPLVLALVLQLLPLARTVLPVVQSSAPASFAMVLRIAVGVAALLGSYQAVSGATAIVAPYAVNATNGIRYIRQLGTSVRTAFSWSAGTAPLHAPVYPLTPGLYLTNLTGKIGGTPTWSGTSNITITAWENSDNSGGQVSSVFAFRIAPGSGPPVVSQPPGDVRALRGSVAVLFVGVYGSEPLAYQWQFEGNDLPDATNATLSLPGVQTNRTGIYTVKVTNQLGTAQSSGTLTVLTPPAIAVPPETQSVAPGANVVFQPVIVGSPPLSYRWRFNGENIFGGTNSAYSVSSAQSRQSGLYTLVVSNPYGTVSSSATLTVNGPPEVIVPPQSRAVGMGGTAIFSVTAGGQPPLSFQWLKEGELLPGKTDATLSLPGVGAGDVGRYSVVVSNALGFVASPDVFLRLSFGSVPSVATVYRLTNVWRYDQSGQNLANSWRDVDFNDSAWPAGAGILGVEDSANPIVFANRRTTLSLVNGGGQFVTNFYFRSHFTLTNRAQLSTLTFSNVVDDGAVFYLNGTEIFRVNMPAGAISSTTPAATTSTEGVYTVNVVGSTLAVQGDNVIAAEVHQVNNASSDIVMGSVLFATYAIPNTAPLILMQPASAAVDLGRPVTLSSDADGTGQLSYQWLKDGAIVPAATGTTLGLPSVQAADLGGYSFVARNSYGSTTSRVATVSLRVTNLPPALLIEALGGNVFRLRLSGRSGQNYKLQASADLADWQDVADLTTDAEGAVLFTDPDAGLRSTRFYRAVER